MGRKKLQQFAQMKTWPHVYEHEDDLSSEIFKGHWNEQFKNDNPIVLELACGRGDYTLGLAERFPEQNFIGVDIKGARMWHGAQEAMVSGLKNAAFLRVRIEDLAQYFDEGEISEIWITFADPHPRKGKANKRLTSPRFLNMYKKLLCSEGMIKVKHDNPEFFEYSVSMLQDCGLALEEVILDVYSSEVNDSLLTEIQTTYEKRHLKDGRTIAYACGRKMS